MEQKNLMAVARKWWVVLIAAAVVGGLVARGVAAFMQPTYESTVRLLTGPTSADVNTLDAAGGLARTYSELATSQPQLQAVAGELGLTLTPDQLAEDVQSTSNDVTRIVAIRVRQPTADGALQFAKRLGNRMVAYANEGTKRDDELADALVRQDALAGLSATQLQSIRDAAATVLAAQRQPGALTVIDPPRLADAPVAPRTTLLVLLGALFGVAVVGAVIVVRERESGTVDDARSLAVSVEAPMLGAVNASDLRSSIVVQVAPQAAAASQVRSVADQIAYLARDGSVRSVVFIGAEHGVPNGALAANLAAALAAVDFGIVVVDADPDQGDVTRAFQLEHQAGLFDYLGADDPAGGTNGAPDLLGVTVARNLTVVPAGGSGAMHRRLDPRRVREIVEGLRSDFDMVLIAPPPLEGSSDGLVWAEQTDGTVIVAEQRTSGTGELVRAGARVKAVRARIIGTVLCTARAIPGFGRFGARRRPATAGEGGGASGDGASGRDAIGRQGDGSGPDDPIVGTARVLTRRHTKVRLSAGEDTADARAEQTSATNGDEAQSTPPEPESDSAAHEADTSATPRATGRTTSARSSSGRSRPRKPRSDQ